MFIERLGVVFNLSEREEFIVYILQDLMKEITGLNLPIVVVTNHKAADKDDYSNLFIIPLEILSEFLQKYNEFIKSNESDFVFLVDLKKYCFGSADKYNKKY